MKNLKKILLEYLSNKDVELYQYAKRFEKLSQKDKENFYFDIYDFHNWLENNFDDDEEEAISHYENVNDIPEWLLDKYHHYENGDYETQRTQLFTHMEFKSFLKKQWLIHFTDDARRLALQGFKFGVEEFEHLAFTTDYRNDSNEKKYGGYNFAYLPYNAIHDGLRMGKGTYGNEVVMFKSSGTFWYHYGDQEPQVIFWGANATDFVPITKEYDDWIIYLRQYGDKAIKFKNLADAISWVEKKLWSI